MNRDSMFEMLVGFRGKNFNEQLEWKSELFDNWNEFLE